MAKRNEQDYEELIKGIWRDNPIFVQVLGMCPMLAVTNSAINALAMGGATFFVLVGSSLLVSTFKSRIPKQVRISVFIIIIATFVTVADYALEAMAPVVHKALGPFVPLIVVNCIILGRQEAFASKNTVKLALLDAVGMAGGFMIALLSLGSIREMLGSGSLFGVSLFGSHFEPWVIMVLPPGGFITLGLMLLVFNWFSVKRKMFLEEVSKAERSGA